MQNATDIKVVITTGLSWEFDDVLKAKFEFNTENFAEINNGVITLYADKPKCLTTDINNICRYIDKVKNVYMESGMPAEAADTLMKEINKQKEEDARECLKWLRIKEA
ncbi:MAG: hypothetical protein QME45_04205 [Clostridiales bacterium]|nr:hypothetical protein [Clostridiales bacterium]